MNKVISLLLALVICLTLCACGKSEAAELVDSMILSIGTVTLNSEDALLSAEKAYDQLSEKDKDKVENLAVLLEARIAFDKLIDDAMDAASLVDEQLFAIEEQITQLDIFGALDALDTITPVLVSQEYTIDNLYSQIDSLCFPGTHFLTPDAVLNLQPDGKYLSNGKGTVITHDVTELSSNSTDIFTYHFYCFFEENGYEVASAYRDYMKEHYSRLNDIRNIKSKLRNNICTHSVFAHMPSV